MNPPLETTLQGYLRVQSAREAMQSILQQHVGMAPKDRNTPRMLSGAQQQQTYRDHLARLACEESRLRQRLRLKPDNEKRSVEPDHWWRLCIVDMSGADPVYFPLAGPTVIGRDDDCDLILPLPDISRRHVVLTPSKGGIAVIDLISSNGTWVNGMRVRHATLQQNHRIQIGDVMFAVRRNMNPWRLPLGKHSLRA